MAELIENELNAILDIVAGDLTESDVESIRELIQSREWGVGFENLCTQLYEYEAKITKALYERLEAIGNGMELPKDTWEILKELIV